MKYWSIVFFLIVLLAVGCTPEANSNLGQNWAKHGFDDHEQRFSPLNQINDKNVDRMGLVWSFETQTYRGLEATPIMINGVLYTTASWNVVFAIDARTGKEIWKWDPDVPRSYAYKACCDVINRGVAVYEGKVYTGTLDGRLVALDAETGKVMWEVVTVDQNQPYTITGAPRVVNGKVIIGNAGAEFGVRGYVSAYDSETGEQIWRFYTVPGNPSKPFESPALEKAAKTWKGEWWKLGGGGTVWDSIAYDPSLNLLYIGTGNGGPWNRHLRSPGGGDNLFLASILALQPDTGELVWYYQTTPGDTWDYTATQHMILADLWIQGELRKVLMQAPKNGFFYVLDRTNGQLISADNYVPVNWASRIDEQSGRPVEIPGSDYQSKTITIKPGPLGGHNWHPMSYNTETGLVYIPAQELASSFSQNLSDKYLPGARYLGADLGAPESPEEVHNAYLLAWDPIQQKEKWRIQHPIAWNGGTLTTAGNLVFQGTGDGRFVAYRANNGEKLREVWAGSGIIAAPITYQLDGIQYISLMAGWGGAYPLVAPKSKTSTNPPISVGRLLTFALDGTLQLPVPTEHQQPPNDSLASTASATEIKKGGQLFSRWCDRCHGPGAISGGLIKDLRYSTKPIFDMYPEIILENMLEARGMPSFKGWLNQQQVQLIRSYVIKQASDLRRQNNTK